jgi:XTP/dITP diphosphohydrolase
MAYENLIRLVEVMKKLRTDCPWDAEQTHESLIRYQLEESYEFIEAVESGNRADLKEELGDLLLQVYFHAEIADEDEREPFNIDDVAAGVADKLIARHPHVFGDVKVNSSADVKRNWEEIKNEEKGRTQFDEGVPIGQPALPLAAKLILRAEKNGLNLPPTTQPASGVDENSLGDAFLALISWAVERDIDPEAALRKAALRYRDSLKESK